MNPDKFESLLKLAVTDLYFTFNDQLYSQIDDVAMGSPLGPIFANIFMSAHESRCMAREMSCETTALPSLCG